MLAAQALLPVVAERRHARERSCAASAGRMNHCQKVHPARDIMEEVK